MEKVAFIDEKRHKPILIVFRSWYIIDIRGSAMDDQKYVVYSYESDAARPFQVDKKRPFRVRWHEFIEAMKETPLIRLDKRAEPEIGPKPSMKKLYHECLERNRDSQNKGGCGRINGEHF